MKKLKNTLHIIVIALCIFLCYQMHTVKTILENEQQRYEYTIDQIENHGTLCNIEHITADYLKPRQ